MQIPIYQIDAFTNTLFGGNPAAVMPLERWLPDEVLQAIAAENNLSETAFLYPPTNGKTPTSTFGGSRLPLKCLCAGMQLRRQPGWYSINMNGPTSKSVSNRSQDCCLF